MERRRTFFVITALSIAVTVAGCGTSASPTPEASTVGSAPSRDILNDSAGEWINRLCEPISKFNNDLHAVPPTVELGDAEAAMKTLADHFDKIGSNIDTVVTELKKLGPSPLNGGDKVRDLIITEFNTNRETINSSVAKLRGGQAGSEEQILQDTAIQLTSLSSLAQITPDATELSQALRDTPSCRNL